MQTGKAHEPPGESLWQLSEDRIVVDVCMYMCVREREHGCLFVSVQPHIHAYLSVHVCESVCTCACACVCVVHGQRPCQKPEARLASLK